MTHRDRITREAHPSTAGEGEEKHEHQRPPPLPAQPPPLPGQQPTEPPAEEQEEESPPKGPRDLARKVTQLEREKAELTLRLASVEELVERAKKLRVGEHVVLAEDGEFETVLLHRKRSARPTGRYVPKHNYRFAVPATDEETLGELKQQGAVIVDGVAGTQLVTLAPNIRPLADDERPPSFTLPDEVAKHALAAGAVEEELA